jgi:hypothetical protein
MNAVQLRGGVPSVLRESVDVTGRAYNFPFPIWHLKMRNGGANVVRCYFTAEDFVADANYVVLPVASATFPYGEWEGPVEADKFCEFSIWLKAIGGSSAVEIVGFQRRG